MKTKIAVMSLCFTTLIYLVLTVAVAGLLASFPEVPEARVMLVLTLPNLTAIPGILAVPVIAPRATEKALSVGSLALLLLGGVLCLTFHRSLPVLLAASALMGAAYGVISTLYPMLVNAHFTGRERLDVMGLCAAMLQGGRLVTYLLGGLLAKRHWYDVYYTYVFVLIALLLVAVCLPGGRPAGGRGGTRDSASLKSPGVWRLALFAAVYACLYFIISTHGSVYIEEGGLGTSALTGTLSALACAVAGVFAALFGPISRRTGRMTFPLAFALLGAGYMFAGVFVGRTGAAAAFTAGALGIALFSPWLMTAISDAAGTADAPVATALVLTVLNGGYFASPYLSGALGGLLGGVGAAFAAFGALALAFAAVTAVQCRRHPPV